MDNSNINPQNHHDEYVESQLVIVSKIISNAVKYITTIEVKGMIEFIDSIMKEIGDDDKSGLLPLVKKTAVNTLRFLTTEQINNLISFVERKPIEEVEKIVYDMLNIQYRILEKAYNGFLEFMVAKMNPYEVNEEPEPDLEINVKKSPTEEFDKFIQEKIESLMEKKEQEQENGYKQ